MRNEVITRYIDIQNKEGDFRVEVTIDVARICGYIGYKAAANRTKFSRIYGVRAKAKRRILADQWRTDA